MSKNLYIVPYDFTPITHNALEYALFLGEKIHLEIMILHIAASREKGKPMVNKLVEVKNKLNVPEGVEVSTKVVVGNLFSDIGRIAKENAAQLIIMGTHGSRGMQKIFGAKAMKVIVSAECPFIVVQKNTKPRDIKSVVVPIDLTKESMQIVNYAGDIANIFNAEVHVLAEKQTDQILNTRIQNRIKLVKEQYEERNVNAQISFVKRRSYGKRVMNYVKANKIDMIAIAYHSESLFPQFDSFAPNLITNKEALPVLIVNSKLASALYF